MGTNTLTVGASISTRSLNNVLAFRPISGQRSTSISSFGRRNVCFRLQQRSVTLRVSCAAKPQTVEKVCTIVKKQLSLPDDSDVTAESKLASLGADSIDTAEIVTVLEDEFGIIVEESTSQNITTVQEAADLIEEILRKQQMHLLE